MTEPIKERGLTAPPKDEQSDEARQEASRSSGQDAVPASPEGEANAGMGEQIVGVAMDTIVDGEGNILEPPD
ncbi:hypothetical protein [Vitiosangium sp. GDMCC 1.1324]|uniref:hypothetical protein n=1 Tax=Vitiosangium sp. (strain GDMCC 1.1324) TaxID=2138576 RepID=UPI000D3C6B38|nr:hypothetical protein [Vitiosangium sp. GDMCC 1.1324]PTL79312.1 hypothetical protein DAT35_34490 [Vitiosangium sp. GDMCC 1.1324]